MLDRILVPVDGSETALAILPHIRRLLQRHDGRVILLRVAVPHPGEEPPAVVERSLAAIRAHTATIGSRLEGEGVQVQVEVRVGPPAGTILDTVEKADVTLVAMATHGRTGLARLLLGSVAEHVIRKCPVPVFVVRPIPPGSSLPPGSNPSRTLRNILVPINPGAVSIDELGPAIEMSKLFEARLVLLHVLRRERRRGDAPSEELEVCRERFNGLAGRIEALGARTITLLERGDVPRSILENARFHQCDLIVMTTQGRGGIAGWMGGSMTEEILRQSEIPLLVVRAGANAGKRVPSEAERTRQR
jgi:nucleotide-binding universal stress UspA family protein